MPLAGSPRASGPAFPHAFRLSVKPAQRLGTCGPPRISASSVGNRSLGNGPGDAALGKPHQSRRTVRNYGGRHHHSHPTRLLRGISPLTGLSLVRVTTPGFACQRKPKKVCLTSVQGGNASRNLHTGVIAMNFNGGGLVWLIVGVLAIIALLIFIIPHLN